MRIVCDSQKNEFGAPAAEWLKARLGKVTASESGAALARLSCEVGADCKKGNHDVLCGRKVCGCSCHNGSKTPGEAAERSNYKLQLVAERLTGKVTQQFVSIWMKNGTDFEDEARAHYECHSDSLVEQTGFVLHPKYDYWGASPDGLLMDGGVLEIKVPAPATHLKYLLGKVDPREDYGAQMLGEIICCEAPYCQFVSYNPFMPSHLKLFTKRYERGDMMAIDAYEREIEQFNSEVEAMVKELSLAEVAA